MNDRETLELAAKAAGIDNAIVYDEEDGTGPYCKIGKHQYWRPLQDDGDALRLAVKLGMLIGARGEESWAQWYGKPGGGWITIKEPNGDDPYAALRRAIVLCAVEIGRVAACNT